MHRSQQKICLKKLLILEKHPFESSRFMIEPIYVEIIYSIFPNTNKQQEVNKIGKKII